MGRDLVRCFEDVALDPKSLRCIVLTGAGDKAFCAGGDLKERRGMTDEAWARQHVIFERMVRALIDCPVPTIGAINGAAYGGGCEIAGCCDFLYAADTARFALTEVTLGIMPGGGGTQTLPRAVGERRAKELILSGLPFTAEQAEAWGLVNRVVEPEGLMEATLAIARRIAANGPIAVRQAKQAIHRGLQMSLWDGLAFEIEADSLGQAAEKFAGFAAVAVERAVKELQELRRQQSSSIVIPEGMPGAFGGPGGLPGKIKLP
jgi:enoyl-CoA hydratase/carnithine racemase